MSKSKNSLGDKFVFQKDDFTRGQTSDIIHCGMLREKPPKRGGGIWHPHLRLI